MKLGMFHLFSHIIMKTGMFRIVREDHHETWNVPFIFPHYHENWNVLYSSWRSSWNLECSIYFPTLSWKLEWPWGTFIWWTSLHFHFCFLFKQYEAMQIIPYSDLFKKWKYIKTMFLFIYLKQTNQSHNDSVQNKASQSSDAVGWRALLNPSL